MIVVRGAAPQRDFTIIANTVLRDARLSFRARGVLAYVLSMPEGFRMTSESIAKAGREGRDAIRAALEELEQHGYLTRERQQLANGTWMTVATVFDAPIQPKTDFQASDADSQEPMPEKPMTGKPTPDFQASNTENCKEDKKKKERRARGDFDFGSGEFTGLPEQVIESWQRAYPAINVPAEMRRAAAWLMANPANRKSDYVRFLNGWMSRAQDRAPALRIVTKEANRGNNPSDIEHTIAVLTGRATPQTADLPFAERVG